MRTLALSRDAVCMVIASALLAGCGGNSGSASILPAAVSDSFSSHKTFHFTGNRQSFEVPPGVKWIDVVARGGAGGGEPSYYGKSGAGLGGRVHALLPVRQGETLYIFVAGGADNGGYNGGGRSAQGSGEAGFGGGGASDVRQNGYALANRVLVAGGGGGEGGLHQAGVGGAGGGAIGKAGGGDPSSCGYGGGGGGGGSQNAGGAGGCGASDGSSSGANGQPGTQGSLGEGGNGGAGGNNNYFGSGSAGGGGGGGGGYYGGGGGGGGGAPYFEVGPGGGGGGGSSYVERSAKRVHSWQGWKNANGDGLVVFSW